MAARASVTLEDDVAALFDRQAVILFLDRATSDGSSVLRVNERLPSLGRHLLPDRQRAVLLSKSA